MTTEYIDLAQNIMALQRKKRLESKSKLWRPSLTPATDLGYACERRIVYHRLWPEKAAPISEELASIFEEGNLHQVNVRIELAQMGIEVVEAERNFRDERLEITGSIDGKIVLKDDYRKRVPLEIKSSYGDGPTTEEQWRMSESALLRRYFAQLEIYMFLTNEANALALFKNKQTGLYSVVAVTLDYQYVEDLLKKAERVRDAVALIKEAITDEERYPLLPQRIADRSECPTCPWRDSMCLPSEAPVDPLLLAQDIDLQDQLIERNELDEGRKRFKKLDDTIKTRLKLTKGDRFVCGDFLITKKVTPRMTTIKIKLLKENEDNDR